MRLKHQVERTWLGQFLRTAIGTLAVFQLVSSQARLAFATVDQRITKSVFVSRVFPYQPVKNDRRIEALDVVALVDHPAPPGLLDVVAKLDAERAIVPGAAKATI